MRDLRVALIGGGFMGKAHSMGYGLASVLHDPEVRIHKEVLVEIDEELAERTARDLGWNSHSTNWREVVARPDIDIVDIVTPPHLHAEIAKAAIAAGKHVFSEKPITNDASEADEMWAAAQAAGVTTQVGYNYRHTPAITLAKRLIERGRIGRPLQYRSSYLSGGGLTAAPGAMGWRSSKATGGSGSIGDVGSHILDIAEYLNGEIVRVSAVARSRKSNQDPEAGYDDESVRLGEDLVENAGFWLAEFANGSIGMFTTASTSAGRNNQIRFELDATKGALAFDWNHREELQVALVDDDPEVSGFRDVFSSQKVHENIWYPVPGLGLGYVDGTAIQLRAFIDSIVQTKLAHPNFGEGAHIQHVVDAIFASAKTGQWVDVPRRSEAAGV